MVKCYEKGLHYIADSTRICEGRLVFDGHTLNTRLYDIIDCMRWTYILITGNICYSLFSRLIKLKKINYENGSDFLSNGEKARRYPNRYLPFSSTVNTRIKETRFLHSG